MIDINVFQQNNCSILQLALNEINLSFEIAVCINLFIELIASPWAGFPSNLAKNRCIYSNKIDGKFPSGPE